jgi:hypothetical protein
MFGNDVTAFQGQTVRLDIEIKATNDYIDAAFDNFVVVSQIPGSQIYYRGYAKNSFLTGYSPEDSFYTEPTPAHGVVVGNRTDTGFTINWAPGSNAESLVVVREWAETTWVPTDGVDYTPDANAIFRSGTPVEADAYIVYVGSGNSVAIDGLTTGNTYYITVYSYSGTGVQFNYQEDLPAKGISGTIVAPLLTDPESSNIDIDNADLGATIDNDGGSPIVDRGTIWDYVNTGLDTGHPNAASEGTASAGYFSHNRGGGGAGLLCRLRLQCIPYRLLSGRKFLYGAWRFFERAVH